jgi:hypothetical protein
MHRSTYFPCFAKESKQRKATRAKSAPRCPCFVVSQTIKLFVSLLAAVFATREFKPQLHQRDKYWLQYCTEGIAGIYFGEYTPAVVSTSRPWSRAVREAVGKVLRCGCLSVATLAQREFPHRLAKRWTEGFRGDRARGGCKGRSKTRPLLVWPAKRPVHCLRQQAMPSPNSHHILARRSCRGIGEVRR